MKVYLVGGAVRDEIMGLPCNDRDWVVVGSSTEEMLSLGYKQVGADFPVFLHPTTGEEYALARTERKSGRGYLGFEVITDAVTIEDDLGRRDLTINSIAKDIETGEYIDPFNGRADIANRILRHTSEAFSEDPLRVIRLARFAARYPFFIADDTILLSRKMVESGALNELPYERFWTEIEKVMSGTDSSKFFIFLFDDLDVQKHVNFFIDLFGRQFIKCTDWFEKLIKAAHKIPVELRTIVFCALAARYKLDKNMKGANSQMIALHKNIRAVYGVNGLSQTDDIYNIMKMARAWGQGPHYENLKLAVGIVESTFGAGALTQTVLEDLQRVILEVKSEHFAPLEGKALGDAIEAARRLKIKTLVESYA